MSFETFKKTINEAKQTTNQIFLHNFGESTFHPQLKLFLEYAKKQGAVVALSINATNLSPSTVDALLINLNELFISFDGVSKKTYETLRKGANYEKSKANVLKLLERKKQLYSNTKLHIHLINLDLTQAEGLAFLREWEGKGVNASIKEFTDFADEDIGKLNSCFSKKVQQFPCIKFWTDCVVLWDGAVVPCCNDYNGTIILGNINDSSLKQIWGSDRLKNLRRRQVRGSFDYAVCRTCGFNNRQPKWGRVYE
jgi:radical SAM protein with 4Fe4S-binding SPASM domain